MRFSDKGDIYHGGGRVTCAACSTLSVVPNPILDHSCPNCRRVLNGTGRSNEPDLS